MVPWGRVTMCSPSSNAPPRALVTMCLPRHSSTKKVNGSGSLRCRTEGFLDLVRTELIIVRERLDRVTGVKSSSNVGHRNRCAGDDGAPERAPRIDDDDPRRGVT